MKVGQWSYLTFLDWRQSGWGEQPSYSCDHANYDSQTEDSCLRLGGGRYCLIGCWSPAAGSCQPHEGQSTCGSYTDHIPQSAHHHRASFSCSSHNCGCSGSWADRRCQPTGINTNSHLRFLVQTFAPTKYQDIPSLSMAGFFNTSCQFFLQF